MDIYEGAFGIDEGVVFVPALIDGDPQYDDDDRIVCKRWTSDIHPERPTEAELIAGYSIRRELGHTGDWSAFHKTIQASAMSKIIKTLAGPNAAAGLNLSAMADLIGSFEIENVPNIKSLWEALNQQMVYAIAASEAAEGPSLMPQVQPVILAWKALVDLNQLPTFLYFVM